MSAIQTAEATRLIEQAKLDRLKTAKERNQWGQFATPPQLSLEIATYAWEKFKHRACRVRFLDPAIGTGSFFGALLQAFPNNRIEAAVGVELDHPFAEAAAAIWSRHGLSIVQGDFTRQVPDASFNVILTNPPYVRHHHLSANDKQRLVERAREVTGIRPSGLSGLYCYFLLIAHGWLADGALAVWLIPSEFMDVNYGESVKRYLTERVTLIQLHRFCPSDVQFDDALVSSAIVVFENRRPPSGHKAIFSFGGSLASPGSSEAVSLDRLRATAKWTAIPAQGGAEERAATVTLGDLFTVKRGLATGNNRFFIVPRERLLTLGIPASCMKPILPSPRYLKVEVVESDANGWPALDRQLAVIDCSLEEDEIARRWPRFAEYLAKGKQLRVHEGYLASRRSPWYSQERRDAAPFVCTYMGRNRERPFRFIWNRSRATVANVYLALYPKPPVAEHVAANGKEVFAALQRIQAEDFFRNGRVYGGGLHKMEPAELMRLPADEIAGILEFKRERQRVLF